MTNSAPPANMAALQARLAEVRAEAPVIRAGLAHNAEGLGLGLALVTLIGAPAAIGLVVAVSPQASLPLRAIGGALAAGGLATNAKNLALGTVVLGGSLEGLADWSRMAFQSVHERARTSRALRRLSPRP